MIRQRVLYVGIGGTGLDLGVHLHEALQREICGPDGRALNRVGTFANLEPNQLPKFVQNLLIDFNVTALNSAVRAMPGGNVTAAQSIQPALDNFPAAATQLRMKQPGTVKSWLPDPPPPPHVEPAVKPYSAGAGQYPTVGRAALFSAMLSNGYGQTIGNDIQRTLQNLGNSLGELSAYTATEESKVSADISVYVGFSLSGGTGAGLFIDILQLVIDELTRQLSGNRATIIPIVYLPSTFDGVLNPTYKKRAELNCAQGILDLQSLVASRQRHSPALRDLFTIEYPGKIAVSNATLVVGAPTIPVIAVIRKSAGMSKDDLSRAVSASVVAQLSYDSQVQAVDGSETANGFGEDLINKVSDISQSHKLGLGTHALMPMIASSLTVPTQKIADIIAKNILVKGMAEQKKLLENNFMSVDDNAVNEFLRVMGFRKMVDVETYAVDQGLNFTAPTGLKSESELQEKIANKRRTATNNLQDTRKLVQRDVKGMVTFNFAEAFATYMASNRSSGVSIVSALDVARQALDRLQHPRQAKTATGSTRRPTSKQGFMAKALPRKVSQKAVNDAFVELESVHRAQVEEFWWDSWAELKQIWAPSVNQGRDFLEKIKRMLSKFSDELDDEIRGIVSELEKADNGVVYYVPTEGRELEAQIRVIEAEALERVRADLNISNLDVNTLFTKIVAEGEGWEKAITLLRTDSPMQTIHEAILEPIRTKIQDAVQPRDGTAGAMKGLPELLKIAVSPNGRDSDDTRDLIKKLGNLVPGHILPTGGFKECRILITYPGDKDTGVQDFIKQHVATDARFNQIVATTGEMAKNAIEFIPTGRGDTIRVNINMIGQGLLDNPEIKAVLSAWVAELSNPMTEGLIWRQRLGYQNVGRIFDARDRENVVAAIVRGLAKGQVEIVEGTVAHPKRLRISSSNAIRSDLVDTYIDIEPLDGLSPWPNVVNGFEKLILSIDEDNDFRADVIESLNVTGAGILSDNDGVGLTQISDVLYELVRLQQSETEKIKRDLDEPQIFGADTLRGLESALEFWTKTFDSALDVKIQAGRFADLRTAMAHSPGSTS